MSQTFIKNNSSQYHDQLICEAKGLELLRKYTKSISIPTVFKVDENIMECEYIYAGNPTEAGMKSLGSALACLHRIEQKDYGLDHNNYIGLNPQKNILTKHWDKFFIQHRLFFQVKLIKETQIKDNFLNILDKHIHKLEQILNDHNPTPCLVHGDLWSGNAIIDIHEKPWLIDPAVYFADREVDLAMTEMFGGFSKHFYHAYNDVYPLDENYSKRKVIYNLYHYLNHYNLFGTSYLASVKSGFEFIVKL
jgi:fructosamine-3-kinase